MQIEIKREADRQILEISYEWEKTGKTGAYADFREQMILHNKIEGLLDFEVINENEKRTLLYNVHNLIVLEAKCMKRKLDRNLLEGVLKEVLSCVIGSRSFMLCENDFVIGPQTVFLNQDNRVKLPYCSGYGHDIRSQLCNLAEFLMNNVEYSDEAAVLLIYNFYMKCRDETITVDDLFELVEEPQNSKNKSEKHSEEKLDFEIENEVKRKTGQESFTIEDTEKKEWQWEGAPEPHLGENYRDPTPLEIFVQSPLKLKILSLLILAVCALLTLLIVNSGVLINPATQKNSVIKVFFAVLVALGISIGTERMIWKRFGRHLTDRLRSAAMREDEETVLLLGDDKEAEHFSLVSDEYPTINVTGYPFYIGSKKDRYIDYELKIAGISKYHLKIDREGGEIYVSDLNSTNGTYVNGVRLKPHIPVRVQRGYELRMANVIFYCN